MKAIPESAYKNLTMNQRVLAAIAAEGRNDSAEVKRLAETSPEGCFTINKLNARVNDITVMTLAINLDLMSCLADWILAQSVLTFDESDSQSKANRVLERSLTNCASIIAARNKWLDSFGISPEDYERFDAARAPLLDELINRAEGMEDPGITEVALNQFQSFFKDRYPS